GAGVDRDRQTFASHRASGHRSGLPRPGRIGRAALSRSRHDISLSSPRRPAPAAADARGLFCDAVAHAEARLVTAAATRAHFQTHADLDGAASRSCTVSDAKFYVIGAGLAGLAAAVALAARGAPVEVIEASPPARGRCRSWFDGQPPAGTDHGNQRVLS